MPLHKYGNSLTPSKWQRRFRVSDMDSTERDALKQAAAAIMARLRPKMSGEPPSDEELERWAKR